MITAQHLQRAEISFVIEIAADKLGGLLPEFTASGQPYALMADHLKIMNSRMVLLNPKFAKQSQTMTSNTDSQVTPVAAAAVGAQSQESGASQAPTAHAVNEGSIGEESVGPQF